MKRNSLIALLIFLLLVLMAMMILFLLSFNQKTLTPVNYTSYNYTLSYPVYDTTNDTGFIHMGKSNHHDNPTSIDCYNNLDCGNNGLISNVCSSNNNLTQISRIWTCNKPGTTSSSCTFSDTATSQLCQFGCSNGQCRNDTSAPNITLISPANNSQISQMPITFNYTVNDSSGIANCSLVINSSIVLTNKNITNIQNNFSYSLNPGSYMWRVTCTDIFNNIGNSENRSITIISTICNASLPCISINENYYCNGVDVYKNMTLPNCINNSCVISGYHGVFNQTCQYGCSNGQCNPPICTTNSNCGPVTSQLICQGTYVVNQTSTPTCINNASCSIIVTNVTLQSCTYGCTNGQCNPQNPRPCDSPLDLCTWSKVLPLGSFDNQACGLTYNTPWPVNTQTTATCNFNGTDLNNVILYASIDNDILNCALNGHTVINNYIHDGCAPKDPRTGLATNISQYVVNGKNTLICNVLDRGIMTHFDACIIGNKSTPINRLCNNNVDCSPNQDCLCGRCVAKCNNNSGFVERNYNFMLERPSEPTGMNAWLTAINNGIPRTNITLGFYDSVEFQNKYNTNSMNDTNFIEFLYGKLLCRHSEPGGVSNWSQGYGMGWTRADIVNGFIISPEFKNLFGC